MSENINSLTRITNLLDNTHWAGVKKYPIDVWGKIFEFDRIITGYPLILANKVIQKLILLEQEITKVEQEINDKALKDGKIQPSAIIPIFKHVRETLINFETISQQIKSEIINSQQLGVLTMVGQLLDHEEDLITEDLNDIKNEVREFWKKVSENSKLPKEVKDYVFEQLSHIVTAIEDYKIIGIRAFRNNYPNSFATVIKNKETFKNDKNTMKITKEIDGIWKKISSVAEKATKTIPKVKGYLGTVEDVGEIGEKIIDWISST